MAERCVRAGGIHAGSGIAADPATALPLLYVVGDIHLADGANAFYDFLDWLRQRPPARLVILGDLFDYWLDSADHVRAGAACFDRLAALRRAGWRVDLLRGNREMAAGRRLAAAVGSRLHWPRLDLRLGPRLIRIVHGDRLCDDPAHAFLDVHMRGFWLRTLALAMPMSLQTGLARLLRGHSRRRQLRRRRHHAHATPMNEPQRATDRPIGGPHASFDPRRVGAAARGADSLVAGHIHACWRRRIAGVDCLLVGEWTATGGSWVAGHADGQLHQHDWLADSTTR